MLDLARFQDQPLVRRHDIVRREGISQYLDQILVKLESKDSLTVSVVEPVDIGSLRMLQPSLSGIFFTP